ncbi:MAG: RsmD family RNA methyltransferase [DPANN group archaeon]|nr:RsmD family RNA methyltransferase [DPANN group archaeon]
MRMKRNKFLFLLSGEAVETAVQEVKALFEIFGADCKKILREKQILIVESNAGPLAVKAMCARSAEIRLACLLKATIESSSLKYISQVNFGFVQSPFCVRVKNFSGEKRAIERDEERLASVIWMALQDLGKKPAVDLTRPRTTVYFVLAGKQVYVCEFIWKQEKGEFVGRGPSEKPRFHPTSLQPRLARMIVNLARAKENEMLLDPFCGVGSVLIEGLIVGTKACGVDLDKRKLKDSDVNINAYRRLYKSKNYKLKTGDATKLEKIFKNNSVDAIATDPPYGRSSIVGAKNIDELYSKFLKSAHRVLKRKVSLGNGKYLAMIYPDSIRLKIDKSKWKKVHESELYVHGSLTRKILVLKKL